MDITPGHRAASAAPSVVRARLAVSAAFLGISAGTLGFALLTAAIGSVGTMPVTGIALARYLPAGSRRP